MDLFSPKIKKFLILTTPTSKFFLEKNVLYILRKKMYSEKNSFVSGNGTLSLLHS